MTDVAVIGLGYIGLPTSAIMARAGLKVLGVDVAPHVVETVNSGRIHIEEVDLEALVQGVVARGHLRAATRVEPADAFLIAVPTPFDDNHAPDISYVLAAAKTIAPVLKSGDLIVLESTSPVGTTDSIRDLLAELRPDLALPGLAERPEIAIAYCPERVLPGRILIELIDNDRCIGGITPACSERAAAFYKRFVHGACITTTARVAELVKLSENAFRDVNIAYANELSRVADALDLDVWEVIRLANRHPRVNILNPGPGVGGHCIAVDPWFIVHSAPQVTPLIRTAREVNDAKVDHVIVRALALAKARPAAKLACLGLAFKANIDDFRESPALKVAEALAAELGDRLLIVEPHTQVLPANLDKAELTELADAIERAEIVVVLVDHDPFKSVTPQQLAGKDVYDTRGIWAAAR